MCYLCGREYGTASLPIHIPQCKKKWQQKEAMKPKSERRPLPKEPQYNPHTTGPLQNNLQTKASHACLTSIFFVCFRFCGLRCLQRSGLQHVQHRSVPNLFFRAQLAVSIATLIAFCLDSVWSNVKRAAGPSKRIATKSTSRAASLVARAPPSRSKLPLRANSTRAATWKITKPYQERLQAGLAPLPMPLPLLQ